MQNGLMKSLAFSTVFVGISPHLNMNPSYLYTVSKKHGPKVRKRVSN